MVAAYSVRQIGLHSAKWIGFQAAIRAGVDAKMAVLGHMESLNISWHEQENSGNKLKRIERGGDSLDKVLRLWITSYIEIGVNFVGILFVLSRTDWAISVVMLIYGAVFTLLSSRLMIPAVAASRASNIEEEKFIGTMFELIANIRTVKVLGMSQELLKRVRRFAHAFLERLTDQATRFTVRNVGLSVWAEMVRLTSIAIIIAGILTGRYEIGFLTLFMMYFGRMRESVRELADNAQQIAIAREGIVRMRDILREPVDIANAQGKQPLPSDWKTLRVADLRFTYGGKAVLKDISFEIKRGERIGIVGISGAGKSTLFKLLLKEREGFQGAITFDDVPIQSISHESYFDHAAVVLQETEVFNFSLKDNITLTNPKFAHDQAAFRQALTISHVAEFIDKLPEGEKTLIGEKGFKLSGGEKQRLGIARAVFKQPELLFLDEATSHLDSESEQKIQDSLHKFFKNVTAVVIAHRLSTIKEMDRILVLEKGKIIEEGSFNALYRAKGRFRDLWEKQKL